MQLWTLCFLMVTRKCYQMIGKRIVCLRFTDYLHMSVSSLLVWYEYATYWATTGKQGLRVY